MSEKKTALITGMGGGLAQMVGAELAQRGYEVVGVDYRPIHDKLSYEATLYQANYNKTLIEDIFRRHHPTHVLHLGRVGNLKVRMGKRFDLNVMGSAKVMELCRKYETRRLVVLSTFHIYGAHPHNHTPIYEHEPLRAGSAFPQIADAIQLDSQAAIWVYQHPEVQTVLLRPCNVVGPGITNAMSRFLRQSSVPVMIGFNPMVQFIHERDMVSAIMAVTEAEPVGVFNVAGRSPIPWREALDLSGARQIPIPANLASLILKVRGVFKPVLPSYLINFTKYPCVISRQALCETFGWEPEVGDAEAILSTVARSARR